MLRRIRSRGGESEDLDGAVVTGSSEVFVGRVEGDALDVALMDRQGLELLEGMARPDDNLGVQADGDEEGVVVGPREVLNVVLVPDETLVCLPVLDRGWLVRSCFTPFVSTWDTRRQGGPLVDATYQRTPCATAGSCRAGICR